MEFERNYCVKAATASTNFEQLNNELKKLYLEKYILLFNKLALNIKGNKGSFGTGYPFYAIGEDLSGDLPIIEEQLRYNKELLNEVIKNGEEEWYCAMCLEKNLVNMPDLKQICKPCPKMPNQLKPRKVINRLPDMDLWLILESNDLEEISMHFSTLLDRNGLYSSDIDPIQSIKDVLEICNDLENKRMPNKFLPLDAHIIEYKKLKELIESIPEELSKSKKEGKKPYLSIHPLSRRKVWQKDDEAYNFVLDFLYTFTPYNLESDLNELLKNVRKIVANNYSVEQIMEWIIATGNNAVERRMQTKELKLVLDRRINSWKK